MAEANRVVKLCVDHRITLIVDESFIEFTNEHSLAPVAARHPQIVVVRSFTKCFAPAGLKIEYLVGHRSIVKRMGQPHGAVVCQYAGAGWAAESMKDSQYFRKSQVPIRREVITCQKV